MSTFPGHSALHPLHPRQRSMTSYRRFPRELGGRERAREHGPERVGAPARRVLLVLRRHVRGAHGALERLAAYADAVAQLHGAGEATLAGEVEERGRLPGRVADAVTEVLEDPGRVDDVARVHPV